MRRIKIFKIAPFYNQFLRGFYESHGYLKTASYAEQYKVLMDFCFAWSDYWKTYLERTGRYEVTEVVFNAPYLQKAWAKENNFVFSDDRWQVEIILEQLRRSGAEVLFTNEAWFQHFSSNQLRELYPHLFIIGYDGTAIISEKVFGGCDLMVANTEHALNYYHNKGKKIYLFKLGFEASTLDKIHFDANCERPYDVTFVGGVGIAKNSHGRRVELLNYLSRHIKLNLFLMEPSIKELIANWVGLIKKRNPLCDHVELMRNVVRLRRVHRINAGPIFGKEMYSALAKSKIALNVHIESTADYAANFRLFEATGVGCCLLTDWKSNISDVFEVDKEVVIYRSFEECLEKIRHLLSHEEERKLIAANGFKRTHKDHTLQPQVEKFGELLFSLLNP